MEILLILLFVVLIVILSFVYYLYKQLEDIKLGWDECLNLDREVEDDGTA